MVNNNEESNKKEIINKQVPKKKRQKTNDKVVKCPYCGSTNVYGMSRVVGYFSRIDNWNDSKIAEFKDRQKGDYKLESDEIGNWKKEDKKPSNIDQEKINQ